MQCSTCGRTWPDEFNVCPICGVSLTATLTEGASGAIAQAGSVAAGAQGIAVRGGVAGGINIHYHGHGVAASSAPAKVYHNLPQPDYGSFIGRSEELELIYRLLRPYPHSRHSVVVIDGIGGIGKSALALEVAHHYLHAFDQLSEIERFQAIIWFSAKTETLTADGTIRRQWVTHTLDEIYTTISVALERQDITRARSEERDDLVQHALTRQHTLLLVDNLDTLDDERVNAFLRELPAPTKCIVTTRYRIDVAYPIHLTGLLKVDGLVLIAQESDERAVTLANAEAEELYDRTSGVPQAIVWSVAQMGYGYGVKTVLRRLREPTGDVARFCFERAMERIRGTHAHRLLMALALFATDASREALGYVADLDDDEDERDQGLVTLARLSLVNRTRSGRFWMLPLTKEYVFASSLQDRVRVDAFCSRQIDYYLRRFPRPPSFQIYTRDIVIRTKRELDNLFDLLDWCQKQDRQRALLDLFLRIHGLLGVFGDHNRREQWGSAAIAAAEAIGSARDLGVLYAFTVGWLNLKRGDLRRARRYLEKGLASIRQSDDREAECLTLRFLARLEVVEGNAERALQIYQQALSMAEEGGFDGVAAGTDADMAYWHLQHGSLEEAEKRVRTAIDVFEDLDDTIRASDRTIMLANILVRQKRYAEAEEILLPSLERLQELDQPEAVAAGCACLAHIRAHQGDEAEAVRFCIQARQIYDRIGAREEIFPIGLPDVCQ
jgi:tetratricopeptide (TPR) repeat protein